MLGGRLRLTQKRRGHRVGHDAILLAAATARAAGRPRGRSRRGRRRGGAGAGGARARTSTVTLVEIDPELAAHRRGEYRAQRPRRAGARGDARRDRAVRCVCRARARPGLGRPRADESAVQRSGAAERLARSAAARGACGAGRRACRIGSAPRAWLLHSAGTLTLIWRADGLAEVLAALERRFGGIAVLPVHGRAGQPAIRVLVRASKGSRAPLALLPGLMLNDEEGRPTAEAEAVLRDGAGAAARRERDYSPRLRRGCAGTARCDASRSSTSGGTGEAFSCWRSHSGDNAPSNARAGNCLRSR